MFSTRRQMIFGALAALATLAALARADNSNICDRSWTTLANSSILILDGHGCNRTSDKHFHAHNKTTIKNVTFVGFGRSSVGSGRGVYFHDEGTVISCSFFGNRVTSAGGGINFDESKKTKGIIISSMFLSNTAGGSTARNIHPHGGAIAFHYSEGTVQSCVFLSNMVVAGIAGIGPRGGAISGDATYNISMCSFLENQSPNSTGGAIQVSQGTIASCTFNGNSASDKGGAIFIYDRTDRQIDFCLTYCLFRSNTATDRPVDGGGGGGIYVLKSSTLEFCTFLSNTAKPTSGGAVYFSDVENHFSSVAACFFLSNAADKAILGTGSGPHGQGGGIYAARRSAVRGSSFFCNAAFNGGAVYFRKSSNQAIVRRCIFVKNHARLARLDKGIMYSPNTSFSEQSAVTVAGGGGGVFFQGVRTPQGSGSGFVSAIVASSTFEANIADSFGGAVAFSFIAEVNVSASVFTRNVAAEYGGAIALSLVDSFAGPDTRTFISNVLFRANIADVGPAMLVDDRLPNDQEAGGVNRTVTLENVTLVGNVAALSKTFISDGQGKLRMEQMHWGAITHMKRTNGDISSGNRSAFWDFDMTPVPCAEVPSNASHGKAPWIKLLPVKDENSQDDYYGKHSSGWDPAAPQVATNTFVRLQKTLLQGCVRYECSSAQAWQKSKAMLEVVRSDFRDNETSTGPSRPVFASFTCGGESCPAGYITGLAATPCTPCPERHVCASNVSDSGGMDGVAAIVCEVCPQGTLSSIAMMFTEVARERAIVPESQTIKDWGRFCVPLSCDDPEQYSVTIVTDTSSSSNTSEQLGCEWCTRCKPGEFEQAGCKANTDRVCSTCPAGFYTDRENVGLCTPCNSGEYSSRGNATCTVCPAGFFANKSESVRCVTCRPGRFSQTGGRSVCLDCQAGEYADTSGAVGCKECPAGHFSAESGSSTCSVCPAGHYTFRSAPLSCLACSSGQYQPDEQRQSECRQCTAGTYSLTAATHCIACSTGMFAADAGQNKCRNCSNPRREYVLTLSGATECLPCHADATTTPDQMSCECKPGYYELGLGLDSTRRPNATRDADLCATDLSMTGGCCLPCEKGSTCKAMPGDMDGTFEFEGRLATRPDFWRVPQEDGRAVIMSCDIPGACIGTERLLKDLEQGRTPSNTSSVSECLIGHTGIMCGSCIEKLLYRPGPKKLCIKCDSVPGNGPKIAFAVAFSFFICVFVTALVLSDRLVSLIVTSRQQQGRKDDVAAVSKQTKTVASRLGTLFPYLQRVVAIDDVFVSISWPPFASAVLRVLKVVILRVSTVLAFVDPCALHVDVMEQMSVALAVMPWTLIVLLGAKFGSHLVLSRRRRLSHRKQRRNKRKAARVRKKKDRAMDTTGGAPATETNAATETKSDDKKQKSGKAKSMADQMATVSIIAIGLLAGKLLHPCVSQQLLLVWVCSPPISGAPHGVMRNAVHIKCEMSDPLLPTLVACAVVGTIMITIGLPAVMAGVVLRDRVKSRAEKVAHAREADEAQGQSLRQMFHVATPLERIAAKAHEKHEATIQKLELLTHQSVHWFVSKFKADMWWWFLLEMLLSLVFISLLQLASSQVWLQYYLAIVVAGIQVMLPALAKPYVEAADNTISIVGGVVYFLLVAAQIPGQFVELNGLAGVTNEVYNARLNATRSLLDATFLLSILVMLLMTLKGLLTDPAEACAKALRRLCRKTTGNGTGAAKVVPASTAGPKQRAGKRHRGRKKQTVSEQKGETDKNTEEKESEEVVSVLVLEHVRDDLLASVSLELRARYRRVWQEAVAVNMEVMATAIQAAIRGHQSRSGSVVHILSQLWKASTGTAAVGDADAKARITALLGELKAEKEREAALEKELAAERAYEAQLEEALAKKRQHEAELEQQLETERQHEAELVRQLEAERNRGQELERGLSSMKMRLVGKHLEKAADVEEAKRILAKDANEFAAHKKQLQEARAMEEIKLTRRLRGRKHRRDSNLKTSLVVAELERRIAESSNGTREGGASDEDNASWKVQLLERAAITRVPLEMVQRFVATCGVDINARNTSGSTALHHVAWWGNNELAAALVNGDGFAGQRADVSACNKSGNTPLHFACQQNHTELRALLLRAGADGAARNEKGEVPEELLATGGN